LLFRWFSLQAKSSICHDNQNSLLVLEQKKQSISASDHIHLRKAFAQKVQYPGKILMSRKWFFCSEHLLLQQKTASCSNKRKND